MAYLALFALYCGCTAVRLIIVTEPLTFGWYVGQLAAGACVWSMGYIYRGDRERRHRARAARRRDGGLTAD